MCWGFEISIPFTLVHIVVIYGCRISSEDPYDCLWPTKRIGRESVIGPEKNTRRTRGMGGN